MTAPPPAAPAEAPRTVPQQKEPATVPVESVAPGFRPGGEAAPVEPRIPPQD